MDQDTFLHKQNSLLHLVTYFNIDSILPATCMHIPHHHTSMALDHMVYFIFVFLCKSAASSIKLFGTRSQMYD